MLIVEGPSGNGVGRALALRLGCKFTQSIHTLFPDGESEVGIPGSAMGQDIFIVQTTYPEQDKRIMELLFLADQAKRMGARSVGAIVPYLAYAREDKLFEEKNNAVSMQTLLKMFNTTGISRLVTVAPHKEDSLDPFLGKIIIPDVFTHIASSMKSKVRNPIVLAPDKGAIGIAKLFANVLGCDFTHLEKRRDRLTGKVSILRGADRQLKGHDVVIVDDMIAVGSTMIQAARFAKENGAKHVFAAAAHLLMLGDAAKKLKRAGVREVYGTNSIPNKDAKTIDVSAAIAESIHSFL